MWTVPKRMTVFCRLPSVHPTPNDPTPMPAKTSQRLSRRVVIAGWVHLETDEQTTSEHSGKVQLQEAAAAALSEDVLRSLYSWTKFVFASQVFRRLPGLVHICMHTPHPNTVFAALWLSHFVFVASRLKKFHGTILISISNTQYVVMWL